MPLNYLNLLEDWQLDFEWLQVRHFVKNALKKDKLPDMEAILLLIGIQESMIFKESYSKEEKQDLMHVGTCHLLSSLGYYAFSGRDSDGWPYYEQIKVIKAEGYQQQERLLKECIIRYFDTEKIVIDE